MVRLFNVNKQYGTSLALSEVNLDILKNEFILISGPSGAGKSTLLKLLYLAEHVSKGQILVDGINLSRITKRRMPFYRRKLGIVFQDFKLIPQITVFENVALVLESTGTNKNTIAQRVKLILSIVEMEKRLDAYPPSLSGGEQQRVAVARAVVGTPKIILADEPTGSLDSKSAAIVMGLLKRFHAAGTTVIVASHNKEHLNNKDIRTVHIENGRVISGTTIL
ncbi:MAG: cell division ATP-binding protein FtsE [Desulfobacteraceae bacterium 4572_19]|nr:MAG: cell division ATP-binding protein FtsE [Desulfobacteraceae bacterium 4572_19]